MCKINKIIAFLAGLLLGFGLNLSAQNNADKLSEYIYPMITTDSAFKAAIVSQSIVVIDFWAKWCLPCQQFLPEYEEVAKTLHKKVGFYKLNFDSCKATDEEYLVAVIPTIIIFKNGEEVKRYVGLTSKEQLITDLKEIIKKAQ